MRRQGNSMISHDGTYACYHHVSTPDLASPRTLAPGMLPGVDLLPDFSDTRVSFSTLRSPASSYNINSVSCGRACVALGARAPSPSPSPTTTINVNTARRPCPHYIAPAPELKSINRDRSPAAAESHSINHHASSAFLIRAWVEITIILGLVRSELYGRFLDSSPLKSNLF
jgi:hypothetical protein